MSNKIPVRKTMLECTKCHNLVEIFRKKSKMKEKGHIKHFYCYKCKERTAHLDHRGEHITTEIIKEPEE